MVQLHVAQKLTNVRPGTQLKKMLERASKWAKIQREAADSMTAAWAQFVPGWKKMLRAFKRDRRQPNPFEAPEHGRLHSSTGVMSN